MNIKQIFDSLSSAVHIYAGVTPAEQASVAQDSWAVTVGGVLYVGTVLPIVALDAKKLTATAEMTAAWAAQAAALAAAQAAALVPQEVTMRQARLALQAAGLLASVGVAIAALPEPNKTLVGIEWEYSSTVVRTQPFTALMGQALGLDAVALDNLFIAAKVL